MRTSPKSPVTAEELRPTGIRIENALARFTAMLVENHGLSETEALLVRDVYLDEKILKIDPIGGGFAILHAAFLEADVLRRAVEAGR